MSSKKQAPQPRKPCGAETLQMYAEVATAAKLQFARQFGEAAAEQIEMQVLQRQEGTH